MQLTPRRRAVIALLVTWPIGFFLVGWIANLVFAFLLAARGSYRECGTGLFDLPVHFAGCSSAFNVGLGFVALLGMLVVAGLIAYGVGRWVVQPIRTMSDIVDQLGPTSLGLRLSVAGPRDETRSLAESIDRMLDRVAEGYEAQRRFAANASHELRTPLATQRALIEVSLSTALTPDQLDLVSRQLLATNARNEALIEGLLVLAETERGLMVTMPQRLDLIAAAVVETHRQSAKERGVEIEARLDPVLTPGEAPLLERLVTNLVQNAIKYNADENGWVRVDVSAPARLTVSNSGPRVPPESVNALFEPFRRARGERLDPGGGVGLGLTIARSVVAAHHGSIAAHANPDGGLVVDVQLPPE